MDKIDLRNIVEDLFLLIHTEREIAVLIAKNQNAPHYLCRQAEEIKDRILFDIDTSEKPNAS